MKIVAETINTKDVEVLISATMTIQQWEALLKNLPDSKQHPLYQFAGLVNTAISKVKCAIETETLEH